LFFVELNILAEAKNTHNSDSTLKQSHRQKLIWYFANVLFDKRPDKTFEACDRYGELDCPNYISGQKGGRGGKGGKGGNAGKSGTVNFVVCIDIIPNLIFYLTMLF